jgi:hypothetical protein
MDPTLHPPVRERAPFDDAELSAIGETTYILRVRGRMEFRATEMGIEPIDEPSIPEPMWARYEIVAYHWGDNPPDPNEYDVSREVTLPPGAIGVELVGANKTEQLPVIFDEKES